LKTTCCYFFTGS